MALDLPDDYYADEEATPFDLGVAAMRAALDEGQDDATAFRLALIEAGYLENVPPCPPPAESVT
jgi:hypothetical protein